MSYPCPYVGTDQETKHCKRPAESPKGWKTHMTRQHGTYSAEQLAAAVGGVVPGANGGRELFLSEVQDTAPGGSPESTEVRGEGAPPPQDNTVNIKKEQMARKFSARMNKFKEKLAARLTQGVNLIAVDKSPDWALSEDDEKLFSESLENCFEILDIDFQIRPVQKTLENPLWVLALPLAALLMIFLPKIMKAAAQNKQEKSDSE